jgi:hypothetical protein
MAIVPIQKFQRDQEAFLKGIERRVLESASSAATQKASRAVGSYLSGFMGLTGVCSGFALDTAERVEKWIRSGGPAARASIELPEGPTKRIQHYEKLLILAVFQSLTKGDDWREIRETWDRALVDTIQRKYQELIKTQTGGIVRERLPAFGDFPTTDMPSIISRLQEAESRDHFLVVLKNPDETIYKWHVVYLHPQFHLLADGANCLTWHRPDTNRKIFLDTGGDYLQDHHGNFSNFFLYRVQFDDMPSRSLLFDRICSRLESLARVSLHIPQLGCYFAASYVLPRSAVGYIGGIESLQQEFTNKLNKLLKDKNFPEFFSVIETQIPRIPEMGPSPTLLGDVREYLPLLDLLKGREGPYQEISSWLQHGILYWLTYPIISATGRKSSNDLSPEKRLEVVEKVLEYRRALRNPYSLDRILPDNFTFLEKFLMIKELYIEGRCNPYPTKYARYIEDLCQKGDLSTLKMAVSYVGNPFIECESLDLSPRSTGDGHIRDARENGHEEVAAYLESIRPVVHPFEKYLITGVNVV